VPAVRHTEAGEPLQAAVRPRGPKRGLLILLNPRDRAFIEPHTKYVLPGRFLYIFIREPVDENLRCTPRAGARHPKVD